MKKNYEAPHVEVVEIELEGILCTSLEGGDPFLPDVPDGGNMW